MIRQLGTPTWFCSFSAAETRWIHLIKILGRLIDNKDYSDEEVKQNEDIAKFVDSYVSCKADPSDLTDLVNLQRHKHCKTLISSRE